MLLLRYRSLELTPIMQYGIIGVNSKDLYLNKGVKMT
jgi:hypothetical protein